MTPMERLLYGLTQAARVGWFGAHYALARRLSTSAEERRRGARSDPGLRLALRRDLIALFRRDLANIEAGHYRMPHDLIPNPLQRIEGSVRFFSDLPSVDRRRRAGTADEPFRSRRRGEALPRYYLQNFHFQSGGWLSRESAAVYDTQVEVLFTGAADAMRRQCLVPLGQVLGPPARRRDARSSGKGLRLLDVGCGTGRLLSYVMDSWPGLAAVGLDLSQPYLDHAAKLLASWPGVELHRGLAEKMPFADETFDAVTCVFLFHELPRKVRKQVAFEIGRVLKPGGRLVLVDSLQTGDKPLYDPLLAAFPKTFHEPYYGDYTRTDLAALFDAAGLHHVSTSQAFLSKVVVFDKV